MSVPDEFVQTVTRHINGQTGGAVRSGETVIAVMLCHVENGLIQHLYFVRNPDKLNLPVLW